MTMMLLATGDVHEAAALCDYLADRLAAADTVYAIGVTVDAESAADSESEDITAQSTRAAVSRDRADALNAVRSRLGAVATVETDDPAVEDPAALLIERAQSVDADEIVVGNVTLARQLLGQTDRPLVVVSA